MRRVVTRGDVRIQVIARSYSLDASATQAGNEYYPLNTQYLYDTRFGYGTGSPTTPIPANGYASMGSNPGYASKATTEIERCRLKYGCVAVHHPPLEYLGLMPPLTTALMPRLRTLAGVALVVACGVLLAPLGVVIGILILWLVKLPRPGRAITGLLTLACAIQFVALSGWFFTSVSSGAGGN